jgi:hypothetical protein
MVDTPYFYRLRKFQNFSFVIAIIGISIIGITIIFIILPGQLLDDVIVGQAGKQLLFTAGYAGIGQPQLLRDLT